MLWEHVREKINHLIQERMSLPSTERNSLNDMQKKAINRIHEASKFPLSKRGVEDTHYRKIEDFFQPNTQSSFKYVLKRPDHQQFSSYIIIGPPGTGKTTIIAYGALKYVVDPKYTPNKRSKPNIFLCASTNYGADRIFISIKDILYNNKIEGWETYIKRLIAQTVKEEEIAESIRGFVIRPFPSSSEDPNLHRKQLDNVLIFVGTVYACADLLSLEPKLTCQSVIFDEASQLTPPQTYLPISKNKRIRSFGLIGDNCQLPPIASLEPLTHSCIDYLMGLPEYQNSRIPESRQITLNIQYRMHPAIRDISSRFARRSILIEDGPNVISPSYLLQDYVNFNDAGSFSDLLNDIFRPQKTVVIIDTSDLGEFGLDTKVSSSRINPAEVKIIKGFTKLIKYAYPNFELTDETLKIVTPYNPQATKIRLETKYNANTVDAFQGQEAAFVFYSLAFAEPDVRSKFAQNMHRIHVGLSRAQKKLIIVGHSKAMNHPNFYNLQQNIFKYEYDPNLEGNIPLGYDPVVHISINQDFYEYLNSIE